MTSSPIFEVRRHTVGATTFIAFGGRSYFSSSSPSSLSSPSASWFSFSLSLPLSFLVHTGHQSALPSSSWLESYAPPFLASNPHTRPSLLSSTLFVPPLLRSQPQTQRYIQIPTRTPTLTPLQQQHPPHLCPQLRAQIPLPFPLVVLLPLLRNRVQLSPHPHFVALFVLPVSRCLGLGLGLG